MNTDNRVLSRWILAYVLLLALALWLAPRLDAQMPQTQHYMVIRHGYSGYDFDCITDYPYTDVRPMAWNAVDGFTEIGADFDFVESVVAVEACNVDNVYAAPDGSLFVWRMSDVVRENGRYAIHVDRGAWWVAGR